MKEMEQRIEKLKEKQNSGEQQVEEVDAEDLQKKEQLRKQLNQSRSKVKFHFTPTRVCLFDFLTQNVCDTI